MMRRLGLVVLVLTLAATLVTVGCSGDEVDTATTTAPSETGTTPEPLETEGGSEAEDSTLTIAISADPSGFDQDWIGYDTVALALFKNLFPYALDYGTKTVEGAEVQDTENVLPLYAESWETTDDGKTWLLKLKEGITFPSGNEMTAEDVKWSKDRAFAAQANVAGVYRMIGLTRPEQIEVVDKYTVKFTQEYASPLTDHIQIISLYIFDSEEMKKHATESDPWAKEWGTQNHTGGGAYNLDSWQRGSELVLKANSQYPLGKPAIDTVRLRVIPSASNRRLQLERGDVDIAFDLGRKDVEDLKSSSDLKVISVPSNEFVYIPLDTSKPPFDDKLVRQAMAYAIPYEQILSGVYGGDARAATSPVPLDMPGHSDAGYPYSYDLDKAKELLSQSKASGGFSTTLAVDAANEEQERIAILISSELEKIGVDVEIEKLDPATFADRRAKKTIPMQIAAGQMWVNDVQYLLATSLTKDGFLNYANYSNPAVEEVYLESGQTTDQDERLAMFEDLQEDILADDVPWLMLAQPNFNLPMQKNVGGWVQPVDALFRLQYLAKE